MTSPVSWGAAQPQKVLHTFRGPQGLGCAGPEGHSMSNTGPESTVPTAVSGRGAEVRSAGAAAGQGSGDVWSERAEAYRESEAHREGRDLDLIVNWAEGQTALDVATGGGHVARRLREAGLEVVTVDPAPGMRADVVCSAEDLPFADGSFDLVVSRVAPHHFQDIGAAVGELARVSRNLVIVSDNLYGGDAVEEAERLRDPTHVRCYSEAEWRGLFEQAGLAVEAVELEEKQIELEPWLERAGCVGREAARVRELLADRIEDGYLRLDRIVLKGRAK
jgi:SAM-dependent methyltransferase